LAPETDKVARDDPDKIVIARNQEHPDILQTRLLGSINLRLSWQSEETGKTELASDFMIGVNPDRPTEHSDILLSDGQSEPGPPVLTGHGVIDLAERIEESISLILGNAYPCVGNLELKGTRISASVFDKDLHSNFAMYCKFERVRTNVRENLT
jgi:hypothetical protein